MDTNDVMKAYRISASRQLLNDKNIYIKTQCSFMSVVFKEYNEINSEVKVSDTSQELLEAYNNMKDYSSIVKDVDMSKRDKEEEDSFWEKYVAMQAKKRKMMEEMLIRRRLFELERISTEEIYTGKKELPYLRGVPASELLSGLI